MRERGHAIPVKGWWLRLARALIQADPRDYEELGKALAKNVTSKSQPFSYSAISNFVLGKAPATIEIVEALCKEYSRLPPAVFFPSSYEECAQMLVTAERYASKAIEFEFDAEVVPLPAGKERRPRRGKLQDLTSISAGNVGSKRRRAAR